MAKDLIVNCDDARELRNLLEAIRALRGKKRFQWCEHRPRRTDRQNRFYWPAFVQPFGDYMRENKPHWTDEMAHEAFKRMYLEVTEIDERSGLVITRVRSTTELNTTEFNEYLDHCAGTMVELGMKIPDPSDYHEPAARNVQEQAAA